MWMTRTRLAVAAHVLFSLYASACGEAERCQADPVDGGALLQVGSIQSADPSILPTSNQSQPHPEQAVLHDTALTAILAEANAPRGHHAVGIFHYRMWAHPHWNGRELPEIYKLERILESAKGFDWAWLVLSFTLAFILRWVWLWQDDDHQLKPHLASMGVWILLACIFGTAIWRRFGKAAGEEWAAGYVFELFFMLENVFVFQYVIHAAKLPHRHNSRILDRVVWAQILFEAVFFLGLAHQLRSVHFLPQLLGIGLTLFGVSTLLETMQKKEGKDDKTDGVIGSAIKRVTSSDSLGGASKEDGLVTWANSRPQLTTAGLVWVMLLIIDFLCEIDTVLTKIEEIPNPYIAFSSSAMAAFCLPELFLLSQDLLFYFPLVKCGIGLILCMLGVQMILAKLVVIQPLVTCAVMLGIILTFIMASMAVERRSGLEAKQAAMDCDEAGS